MPLDDLGTADAFILAVKFPSVPHFIYSVRLVFGVADVYVYAVKVSSSSQGFPNSVRSLSFILIGSSVMIL